MSREGEAYCPPGAADWHPDSKTPERGLRINREVIPIRPDWIRLMGSKETASVERLSREALLSAVRPKLDPHAPGQIDPETMETDEDAERLRDEIVLNDIDEETVSMIERILYTLGVNDVAVLKKKRDEHGQVVEQGTNMWGLGHIVNPETKLALVIPLSQAEKIEEKFREPVAGGSLDTHDQFTKEKYWDFLKQEGLGFTLTKSVADKNTPGGKKEITIQFFYEIDEDAEENQPMKQAA